MPELSCGESCLLVYTLAVRDKTLSFISPSLFHSYLFHQSYPLLPLLHSGLPSRTFAWIVLLSYSAFYFIFSLRFRFWAVR